MNKAYWRLQHLSSKRLGAVFCKNGGGAVSYYGIVFHSRQLFPKVQEGFLSSDNANA